MDPARTALVLIDLQQGILARRTEPRSSAEVLRTSVTLANAFRELRALVVLVHVSFANDRSDALAQSVDLTQQAAAHPEGWDILDPALKPNADHTIVVTKRNWGAFYGTGLDLHLRRRHIDTIVLGGIATPYGVESTARDAYERGYPLYFVEDAMSTVDANDHAHFISRIFPRLGHVVSADEVLTMIRPEG